MRLSKEARKVNNYNEHPENHNDHGLEEKISQALYKSHRLDAREIEVRVLHGKITLLGSVLDEDSRLAAEKCVKDVFGHAPIDNQLSLKRESLENGLQDLDEYSTRH